MRTSVKSQTGMSLVEATIILLILATLTAVLAPSMGDFLEDARGMKAKEDVEAIGISIKRLLRDTGFEGMKLKDGTAAMTTDNRVDVLTSDGSTPTISGATFSSADNIQDAGGTINWNAATNTTTVENQLVRNTLTTTAYATPTAANRGRGWRGAYLNAPIGADPWGYKYYANTVFLVVATDAAGAAEGKDYWTKDVIVVSAGPDNTLQAAIGGSTNGGSGVAASDDVMYTLQGNTF